MSDDRSTTRFICFASYKGGVGRSLAAANTAYSLARDGRKVLLIDFDLDAPGQHMTDLFVKNTPGPGLVELVDHFSEFFSDPEGDPEQPYPWALSPFIQQSVAFNDLVEEAVAAELEYPHPDGQLWLMRAGGLDAEFRSKFEKLNLAEFIEEPYGAVFFEALREELVDEGFDDVIIDSRTGTGDIIRIATLLMADTVVLLSGMQRQHIEGLRFIYDSLNSAENIENYGRKKIILVASPVAEIDMKAIQRREDEIRREWPEFPGFHLSIPYLPSLFLREDILSYQKDVLLRRKSTVSPAETYVDVIDTLKHRLDQSDPLADAMETEAEPSNPFANIRADYSGPSEWSRYFVDPGQRIYEGVKKFMPSIVLGARGSGKTMLARQFAYETLKEQLKRQSPDIDISNIHYIGLYFRIDQDIIRAFDNGDVKLRPHFDHLFSQYLDIIILRKAIKALQALGGISRWFNDRQEVIFNAIEREFGAEKSMFSDVDTLLSLIEQHLSSIRSFINNPETTKLPFKLQPNILMKLLTEFLVDSGNFSDCYFIVMFDEFEIFKPYQKRILNTRLKQSKSADKITYKFFARTGGLDVHETLSAGQPIQSPHDFRLYKLDEDLDLDTFKEHFEKVANRHLENSPYFRSRGWTEIEKLLENLSAEAEADKLAGRKARKDELRDWVTKHHGEYAAPLLQWFDEEPSALRRVTATVVVNQGKDPDAVVTAFRSGSNQARDWMHNYARGALYWLCRLYGIKKTYSGFGDVAGLAGYNIRTGLEFMFAIIETWLSDGDKALPVSATMQNDAIRRQSNDYRLLIKSSDSQFSDRMMIFAERTGEIFQILHRSPKQSEAEPNHFYLSGQLDDDTAKFLEHCYREEILRRIPERKQKHAGQEKADSWQLHPRLAPHFEISWRSKKNVTLTHTQIAALASPEPNSWSEVKNDFLRRAEKLGGKQNERQQRSLL